MPRPIQTACLLLSVIIFGAGCANPINDRTAANYHDAGVAAERRGDFVLARENFHRAYVNAQIGGLGPAAEALPLYEWARVSGYLGKREDAESAFPRVLELIAQANGRADDLLAPTLSEFARYLHDTDQHERAVSIFPDALIALEERDVEKGDPIGFAAFLEDYAESLETVGQTGEAEHWRKRAASLRDANPGVAPNYVPKRYSN